MELRFVPFVLTLRRHADPICPGKLHQIPIRTAKVVLISSAPPFYVGVDVVLGLTERAALLGKGYFGPRGMVTLDLFWALFLNIERRAFPTLICWFLPIAIGSKCS
jgi:hypothetical protein